MQDEINNNVLRAAKVIGLTTTGVASHQRLIRALGPRVIVVEEAAEVRLAVTCPRQGRKPGQCFVLDV